MQEALLISEQEKEAFTSELESLKEQVHSALDYPLATVMHLISTALSNIVSFVCFCIIWL